MARISVIVLLLLVIDMCNGLQCNVFISKVELAYPPPPYSIQYPATHSFSAKAMTVIGFPLKTLIETFSNRFENETIRQAFMSKITKPELSAIDLTGVLMTAFAYWYDFEMETRVIELNNGYALPNASAKTYRDIFAVFNAIAYKIS